MSGCPGFLPGFDPGQLDGTPFAGSNCNCWSAARVAEYDSCGHVAPSSSQVRTWTGDTSGGTNLAQVDQALLSHVGVNLDVEYRLPWSTFVSRIQAGQAAILQGWYAPIRATRFRGSETFGGNHSIVVPPGFGVMDPLADGRRPGIYDYHREPYPLALLRDFAGKLNLSGSGYSALGAGLVYAAFSRDNAPNYRVRFSPGAAFIYTLRDGKLWSRKSTRFLSVTGAPCDAARRYYPHPSGPLAGTPSRRLNVITAGYLKGKAVGEHLPVVDIIEVP